MALHEPDVEQTAPDRLARMGLILQAHLQADVTICYELIPETGGIPRLPPLCIGELQRPQKATAILAHTTHTGMLGDFIRHGQVIGEPNAPSWCELPAAQT